MRHGAVWCVVLALMLAAPVRSQTVGDWPGDVWNDAAALPTSGNAWWLLGGAALTTVVHQFDDADGAEATFNQGVLGSLSRVGNVWGDARLQAPLALGVWGVGRWSGDQALADLGYDLSRSLFLTYAVTSVIKVAVNRERPNGGSHSFPSGHTSAAFSAAGVVTRHYGGWLGGAAVSLGVMTGMGRMADRKHYGSDVVAGATIGWIIGRNAARPGPVAGVSLQVVPLGRGLAVAGRF